MSKPLQSYTPSTSLSASTLLHRLRRRMFHPHCVELLRLALCATMQAQCAMRMAITSDRQQMWPYLTLSQYSASPIRGRYVAISSLTTFTDLPPPTFKRVFERPFSSDMKSMAISGTHTTLTTNGSGREIYYIKGSIEAILPRCKFYHVADGSTPPLDSKVRSGISGKAQAAATRGLRVIAMAYGNADPIAPSRSSSPSPPQNSNDYTEKEKSAYLVFSGFVAMYDPPRKGVADAISLLQSGGVQIVMITGDAEETALSIAKSLGLRGA